MFLPRLPSTRSRRNEAAHANQEPRQPMKNLKPRRLALALLLSVLSLPALADTCNPCDPVDPPKIYAVGTAYTPNWQAALWVDGVRTDLPPLVNAYNTGAKEANAVVVVDNFLTGEPDVYVAGAANITTNNAAAADASAMVWKNGEIYSQVPSLSSTYVNQFASAKALAVDNGNVYTAGYTDAKLTNLHGPNNNTADMKAIQWKNGVGTLLPLDPLGYRGSAKAMSVRNGVTYTLGSHNYSMENHPGAPRHNGYPVVWVNGTRVSGIPFSDASALFTTSTTLYVGGTIPSDTMNGPYLATYAYRPLAWGTAPHSGSTLFTSVLLPASANNWVSVVTGVHVVGTRVYAVGWELRNNGKYVARLWINNSGVDLSDESEGAIATSVFVHKNDVYVGGSTNNLVNQRPKAVVWKNGQMIDFNGGELGSHITAIYVK